jgi:hypothetical protein
MKERDEHAWTGWALFGAGVARTPASCWLRSNSGAFDGGSPMEFGNYFTGWADIVVRPSLTRHSLRTAKGRTPHSKKRHACANSPSVSDDFGIEAPAHPVIVITDDDPGGLVQAMDAIQSYQKSLNLDSLTSLLIDPPVRHKRKQPGSGGMMPPTQTLVCSRPGSASNLRIRVVPKLRQCTPPPRYPDWSRVMSASAN